MSANCSRSLLCLRFAWCLANVSLADPLASRTSQGGTGRRFRTDRFRHRGRPTSCRLRAMSSTRRAASSSTPRLCPVRQCTRHSARCAPRRWRRVLRSGQTGTTHSSMRPAISLTESSRTTPASWRSIGIRAPNSARVKTAGLMMSASVASTRAALEMARRAGLKAGGRGLWTSARSLRSAARITAERARCKRRLASAWARTNLWICPGGST